MSLKAILTAAFVVIGALSLAAASSLILITTFLHRSTESLGLAVDRLHVAEEMEVDLLNHDRLAERALWVSPPGPQYSLAGVEDSLRQHLAEAYRVMGTEEGRVLLEDIERAISAYLAARATSAQLPPEQASREVEARLDEALALLEQLVDLSVAQARAAQARATHWDNLANIGGLGIALLLMLGGLGLLLWLRRFVIRPVLDISRAMRRFGGGRRRTRAPEVGPAELREMARTFNGMADTLSRQQEEQLAFLAGVAHDLRNPLSALKMSAALITAHHAGLSEARLLKTMALMRRQVARLDRMVGDLLDATRIEAGHFELQLEERDIREIAQEVVELYQTGSSQHELQLTVPEAPVLLRCDPTRLEQVLHNLVSNALKYSPSGSRVEVLAQREGEEVLLSVVDRGIGITAEEMRNLFAPFRRAGRAREHAPGVGIGLSVARRIVEAHGGRIEVESRPGGGSTFRVRLPLFRKEEGAQGGWEARPGETGVGPVDLAH